jgi:BirA family biotin operon repressor/biotin-[acetyl-CoA-carboxylase] ligase
MLTPEVLASYQLMGALIVYDTLKKVAPRVQFAIKYPNDVYAYDRKETKWKKISGVLVEHEFMGSVCMVTVIGMGVNIEQDSFSDDVENPISLSLLGVSITVDNFFSELKKFIEAYVDLPHGSIFQRYKKIVNIEGAEVEIKDKTGVWFVESLMVDSRLKVKNTETNEILHISDGDSIRYKLSAEQK